MMYLIRLMAQENRDGSGANAAEKTCVMLATSSAFFDSLRT
jgi:hypothetical protein